MKLFNSVPANRPKLNKFNLSHERKLTFDMGKLVPIMCEEVVPGDVFRVKTEMMLRFQPLLAPMMHRVNVWIHYFFVPNRLIWENWETFITGGPAGTSAPTAPYVEGPGGDSSIEHWQIGSLADYLGIPQADSEASAGWNPSALPFRAYSMIWDQYFRDQNLTTSPSWWFGDGNCYSHDQAEIMTLRTRCWEKDRFTSALPWAQRGVAAATPINVSYKPTSQVMKTDGTAFSGTKTAMSSPGDGASKDATFYKFSDGSSSGTGRVENIDSSTMLINDLRQAVRLQEWLERNARGGARYIEQILSHFGVVSSDARLQRPEYLGGGKAPLVVSEVLSTFQADGGAIPQGNMSGHAFSTGGHAGFKRRFEEHGFVIGLISVLPRTAYQNGLEKMWKRFDKFDYYWPEFANLGEEPIKKYEVMVVDTDGLDSSTFGYTPRYSDYKWRNSSVHGDFKDSLSFWHMGRIFTSMPSLNTSFVEADPTSRIFAVEETGQKMICQLYNRVDALRPMPYFGTPTL